MQVRSSRYHTVCVHKVGDFVLVELPMEEGKNVGTFFCYVAQVLAIMEDGNLNLSFLRMKSSFPKDTFTFPAIADEAIITQVQCKGVLATHKRATKRQADLVKVFPPLFAFNMHI